MSISHGSFSFRLYQKTPKREGEEGREGGEGGEGGGERGEEGWSAPIFLTNNLHLKEPSCLLVSCGFVGCCLLLFVVVIVVYYSDFFSKIKITYSLSTSHSPPHNPSTFSLFSSTKTPDPYSLSFFLFPSLSLLNSLCSPLAFSLSQSEKGGEGEGEEELASGFLLQVWEG